MSKIAQDLADKALAARSVGGVVKAGEYPEWAAGLKEIAEQHYAKVGINKQAAGVMDNIGSYLAANPTLRNSLIGLGGGAGLGALAGLTSGALSDDEDSSTLSKMLNYGLLGGGLGAAGGAAYGLLSKPDELPRVNKAIEEGKTKNIINKAPTTGTPPAQTAAAVKLPPLKVTPEYLASLSPEDRADVDKLQKSIEGDRLQSWGDWLRKKPEEISKWLERNFFSTINEIPAAKPPSNAPGTPPVSASPVSTPAATPTGTSPKSVPGTPPVSAPPVKTPPVSTPAATPTGTPVSPPADVSSSFGGPVSVEPGSLDYFYNQDLVPGSASTIGNDAGGSGKFEIPLHPWQLALTGGGAGVLAGGAAASVKPLARLKAVADNYFASRGLNRQTFTQNDYQNFLAKLHNNLRGKLEGYTRVPDPADPLKTVPKHTVGDIPVIQKTTGVFGGPTKYKTNKSVLESLSQRISGAKPESGIRRLMDAIGLPLPPKTDPSSFTAGQARDLARFLSLNLPPDKIKSLNKIIDSKGFLSEPSVNLKFVSGADPSNSWFNDPTGAANQSETRLKNIQRLFGFSGGEGNSKIQIDKQGPLATLYGEDKDAAKAFAKKLISQVDDAYKTDKTVMDVFRNTKGSRLPSMKEREAVSDANQRRTNAAKAPAGGLRKLVGQAAGGTTGSVLGATLPSVLGGPQAFSSEAQETPAIKENALYKINVAEKQHPDKAPEYNAYRNEIINTPNSEIQNLLGNNAFGARMEAILKGKK